MKDLVESAVRTVRDVAMTALFVALAFSVWHIAKSVESAQADIAALSSSAQEMLGVVDMEIPQLQASMQSGVSSVNTASLAVSDVARQVSAQVPSVATKVRLDLDETHRLILEAGLTAREARLASAEERAALPGMTAKAQQSLDDLHGELVTLNTTTRDLDTLISNPANARTLKNLDEGTAALAATAKDGQQFTHALLHPSWPKRVWGMALSVGHALSPL